MIDTHEKLTGVLDSIEAAEWIALDTEADSLHAYPEKLCLIQLSLAQGDYLFDPLGALDLAPLCRALVRHPLIVHAGDYDLRLLHRSLAFVPCRIFDTMWAARLAGHREYGLQRLVEHYLGVRLEKGPQKADWSRRPLTERMITYARNDTRHLKPLADHLRQRLVALGRLAWFEETCAAQIQDALVPRVADPELVWRLGGSDRLDPRGLAFLRALWHWREREAIQASRPPFFVLDHARLVQIAKLASAGEDWTTIVPARFSRSRLERLTAIMEEAKAERSSKWPQRRKHHPRRWTARERKQFAELEHRRNFVATRLGLDPTLIASRSTLGSLAENWDRTAATLMSWQRELLSQAPEPGALAPVRPFEDQGVPDPGTGTSAGR